MASKVGGEPRRVDSMKLSEESVWQWGWGICGQHDSHWELAMRFGDVRVTSDRHMGILGNKWN